VARPVLQARLGAKGLRARVSPRVARGPTRDLATKGPDLLGDPIDGGADPNARQMMGYTALHAAAAHDNVEMAQALLEAGADPALRNDEGQTAADKAGPKVTELLRATP